MSRIPKHACIVLLLLLVCLHPAVNWRLFAWKHESSLQNEIGQCFSGIVQWKMVNQENRVPGVSFSGVREEFSLQPLSRTAGNERPVIHG